MSSSVRNSTTENADIELIAAELVDSRDTYRSLGDRLDKSEQTISTILERLQNMVISAGGDLVEDVAIDERGHLILDIKTWDNPKESRLAVGNIEMRCENAHIQWRVIGFTNWNNLISLHELMPKFRAGNVIITDDESPSMDISGTFREAVINLKIPKTLLHIQNGFSKIIVNGETLNSDSVDSININTDGNIDIDVDSKTNSIYIRLADNVVSKLNQL